MHNAITTLTGKFKRVQTNLLKVISDNEYLDESWDIVKWAVQQNDPQSWLGENNEYLKDAEMLVETNDYSFKKDLDHY